MPNENLQKMLELSRKVNKMPPAEKKQQPTNTIEENYAPQQMYVPQPQQREPYSADKEMENIRQGRKPAVDLTNSNLPKNIMESIINNPLDLDPSIVTSGSEVTNFMNSLNENSQGIQRMLEMQRQLEGGDKKKQQLRIDEQLKQRSTSNNGGGNGIDYSLIKTIVESVVNEKIAELKEELANNRPDENEVSIMTFRNGFLYVTEDGKVYECTMKFKGYNKGAKKD